MSTLFDSAIANPRWRTRVRAMMLNNYGAYQFNIVRNESEAVRLTEMAGAVDPTSGYFPLNLAKMSAASGNAKATSRYLADAVRPMIGEIESLNLSEDTLAQDRQQALPDRQRQEPGPVLDDRPGDRQTDQKRRPEPYAAIVERSVGAHRDQPARSGFLHRVPDQHLLADQREIHCREQNRGQSEPAGHLAINRQAAQQRAAGEPGRKASLAL
jgi:hypothetical protein